MPAVISSKNAEELKAEAAKLPPDDRFALAEWIERNEDIRELRHAALDREIRIGLDEMTGESASSARKRRSCARSSME